MKKSASKRKTSPIKAAQARTKSVRFKAKQALQKANDAKRALKIKLKTLQAKYKQNLQETAQKSYEKAIADIYQQQEQKHTAKFKALSAAEEKFEKQYASKVNKKMKKAFKAPAANPHTAATMKKSTRTISARRTYKKRSRRAA